MSLASLRDADPLNAAEMSVSPRNPNKYLRIRRPSVNASVSLSPSTSSSAAFVSKNSRTVSGDERDAPRATAPSVRVVPEKPKR